jgi:NAD(P)-dependent dehydrogenase (short-subunit alcohol dehydrogenase family)
VKKVLNLSTGLADVDFTAKWEMGVGAPYSISKAALNMLNAKLHVAYKGEGILFLAISPGLVSTQDMSQSE